MAISLCPFRAPEQALDWALSAPAGAGTAALPAEPEGEPGIAPGRRELILLKPRPLPRPRFTARSNRIPLDSRSDKGLQSATLKLRLRILRDINPNE